MTRALARAFALTAVVVLAVGTALVALGATQTISSDEIGGTSVAAHNTAQALRTGWAAAVAAAGGVAAAPLTLNSPAYANGSAVTGVIGTAADGTSVSVARARYTGGTAPTLVGPSSNPGTASCTSAGESLQGGAPRPTSLESNAACSTAAGFAYAEVGGVGENTTRDAIEFTFSRPVLAFGAWFGDLETRTDGSGLPALVRLYAADGTLLPQQQVTPGPTYLPQANCGGAYTGCGNNTTRWVGFVADPGQSVSRMAVIVGDDDPAGTALDEGISFIGPTLDLSTASISLAKSVSPLTDTNNDGGVGAGDTAHYTFTVTNTGSVSATAVAITDPAAVGLSCPSGAVAAGASTSCTGNHPVTQAEVDAGAVSNTATATATAYGATISSNASTTTLPIAPRPTLQLTKTVAEPSYTASGNQLHYTLTATNMGNVSLTDLAVIDPAPGAGAFTTNCGSIGATVAPGAARTCTGTYTVTQADVDGGLVSNTATASATAPGAVAVGPVTAGATSSAVQQVSLSLSKQVDHDTYDAVGQTLTYTVSAANTGNVTQRNVSVSDPPPGDGAFALNCAALPATLAPGDQGSCTATYSVTQDDIDNGSVTNVAQVHANASGSPVEPPPASATSTAVTHPGLGLVKTVDQPTFDAVGDVLSYTVTLTNTGNVRLHGLEVDDPGPGGGTFDLDCSELPVRLAAGASASCVATHTVTQADLDHGVVVNTATASGLLPAGDQVDSPTAATSSTAEQSTSLRLTKTAQTPTYSAVGDTVTFRLRVSNAGNVTLTDVDASDLNPGAGDFELDCDALPTAFGPGDVGFCTATYDVTQADLDAGRVDNTAHATATGPGGTTVSADAQASASAEQSPAITVRKTVDADAYSRAGDVLTYTITVVNRGNVSLDDVAVSDASPGAGDFTLDCSALPATLAPDDRGTCAATYRVTQADVDAGSVVNDADVAATAPTGPIAATSLIAAATAQQDASLDVHKSVDSDTYDQVGDLLTYEITVANAGNVTLTDVAVVDAAPGSGSFELDCSSLPLTLDPGDAGSCAATYTVTQADLDGGVVNNTAVATGTAPDGPVSATSETVASAVVQGAALDVGKSVDINSYDTVGDVLTYDVPVTNIGNVTVHHVAVADPAPGAGAYSLDCTALPTDLVPGDSGNCSATYAVTQADLDGGSVSNTATASATSLGGPVSATSPTVTSIARGTSGLDIAKTVAADSYHAAGDVLSYTVTVANSGGVTLHSVVVDDPSPGAGAYALDCSGLPGVLAPGGAGTCTASYTVTPADIDAGSVVNTATASGLTPALDEVLAPAATATATAQQAPGLALTKVVQPAMYDSVGDQLDYTLTVVNNGNVTLSSVAVLDAAPGQGAYSLDCAGLPGSLAPGDSGACSATYSVVQADLDAGSVVNTATASGLDPGGATHSTTADATSAALANPGLTLTKTVAERSYQTAGDRLHYRIVVRNTGNVTLHQVNVRDPAPGSGEFATTCGQTGPLVPGESSTCRATYTVTAADLAADGVVNTAFAVAPGQVSSTTATVSAQSDASGPTDPGGPNGPDGPSGPGLPGTGSPVGLLAMGLGAAALVVGLALVAVGRRRPRS